jgi:hypothetical protein
MVETTITQPDSLIASLTGGIRCNGDSAKVNITAAGGTAPYSGTGKIVTLAGTYTFVVTDSRGCQDTLIRTFTNPPTLVASATITSIMCNGDSAIAIVGATGGVPPYFGPGTYTVPAGTYTYGVKDTLCCIDTAIAVITEPPPLFANASIGVVPCLQSNTTVSITATGGTPTYSGTGVYTVGAGSYIYQVWDMNGCTDTIQVDIDTSSCTGIDEYSLNGWFSGRVYPNPNNGSFNVVLGYNCKAQIINQAGQLIRLLDIKEETEVRIDDLSKGMYFLITPKERIKIGVIFD